MANVTAVLLDTVSIQKYVFAGNRLSENLGASALVRKIFDSILAESVREVMGKEVDIAAWEKHPEEFAIEKDGLVEFEVGYIGGGNALLFFGGSDSTKKAKSFVGRWTEKILVMAPGLATAVAIKSNFDFDNLVSETSELYKQLAVNKNRYFPVTRFIKHGISRDCKLSNGADETEVLLPDKVESVKVSWEFARKVKAAHENPWNSKLDETLRNIMGDKFYFSHDLDKLGQIEGDSHIAVVHIDGNNMSKAFAQCKTLVQKRRLSLAVSEVTEEVVGNIVEEMCKEGGLIKKLETPQSVFRFSHGDKKNVPFRPIVLEGDDITFVTDGRLGVYLAKTILEEIEKLYPVIFARYSVEDVKMSACAGVAIVKTKYPFYRAYTLAEELCASAKKMSREHENTSWLDIYCVHNSFAGALEDIRKKHYTIMKDHTMFFGPYLVCGQTAGVRTDGNVLHNLLTGIKVFNDPQKWPRRKAKELRELLAAGPESVKEYLAHDIAQLALPQLQGGRYHEKDKGGWEDKRTPYIDMLDLLDFYPQEVLVTEGGQTNG